MLAFQNNIFGKIGLQFSFKAHLNGFDIFPTLVQHKLSGYSANFGSKIKVVLSNIVSTVNTTL